MTTISYENHYFVFRDFTGENRFRTAEELSKLLRNGRYWGSTLSYFTFRDLDIIIDSELIED